MFQSEATAKLKIILRSLLDDAEKTTDVQIARLAARSLYNSAITYLEMLDRHLMGTPAEMVEEKNGK